MTFSPGDRVRPKDRPDVHGTVVSVEASQNYDGTVNLNAPIVEVRVQWDGGDANFVNANLIERIS